MRLNPFGKERGAAANIQPIQGPVQSPENLDPLVSFVGEIDFHVRSFNGGPEELFVFMERVIPDAPLRQRAVDRVFEEKEKRKNLGSVQ
ncbi:MAG: hypothetical protein Q8P25_04175 [Candidatus Curtissbacteria bacterium]|nr:hypothetical protein [Candidatus Curtissbacteria bacterium]MDZ4209609.1 hypothetical protein [Candidatus Curtissbacteria bacterium]